MAADNRSQLSVSYIKAQNDLSSRKTPLIVFESFILASIALISVFGNGITLLSFYKCARLRTAVNLLVISLALSNLLTSLTVIPVSSIILATGEMFMGSIGCQVFGSITYFLENLTFHTMCIIAVNRLTLMVVKRSWYLFLFDFKGTLMTVFTTWLFQLLYAIVPAIANWSEPFLSPGYSTCGLLVTHPLAKQFYRTQKEVVVIAGFVIIMACYVCVYVKIKHNKIHVDEDDGSQATVVNSNQVESLEEEREISSSSSETSIQPENIMKEEVMTPVAKTFKKQPKNKKKVTNKKEFPVNANLRKNKVFCLQDKKIETSLAVEEKQRHSRVSFKMEKDDSTTRQGSFALDDNMNITQDEMTWVDDETTRKDGEMAKIQDQLTVKGEKIRENDEKIKILKKSRSMDETTRKDEMTKKRNELTQRRNKMTKKQDEMTEKQGEMTKRQSEMTKKQDDMTKKQGEKTNRRFPLIRMKSETKQSETVVIQVETIQTPDEEQSDDYEEISPQRNKLSTAYRHNQYLVHLAQVKTTRILFTFTIFFLVSWIPISVMLIVESYQEKYVSRQVALFGMTVLFLGTTFNPIILAVLSRDFRLQFYKVLGIKGHVLRTTLH